MKYNYEQNKSDYETPPVLYNLALEWINKKRFDLDTCCSNYNIPATLHCFYGEHDGLKEDWCPVNWCNPPFEQCNKWIKKAFKEQQKGNTTVMLLPVRTETKYWHDYILFNPNVEIKWLRKGYKFIDSDSQKELGIFKNALALVLFKGTCKIDKIINYSQELDLYTSQNAR